MKPAAIAFFVFTALILIGGAISIVKLLFLRKVELPPCGTTLSNPKGSVGPRHISLLALGAPLSAHWRAYIDSLETGYSARELRSMLGNAWGVTDARSFASRVAELLSEEHSHRAGFDVVCAIYREYPRERWDGALDAAGGDPDELRELLERLDADWPKLEAAGLARRTDLQRSVAAWDYSRVVSLARAAYDAGFISDAQAWQAIEQAAAAAREDNHSWPEFVASYLIGRTLWGGDESIEHFVDVCGRMFADAASPWRTVPWL
jgi:hypothetical protein